MQSFCWLCHEVAHLLGVRIFQIFILVQVHFKRKRRNKRCWIYDQSKVFCFILNLQYFLFISSGTIYLLYLGDNCIQNVNLGRYIVSYMVGNFVLNVISDHITDDIPPQMKILTMVIPILMHFLTFIQQRHSILHQTEALSAMCNNYVNQSQATSLMMLVL